MVRRIGKEFEKAIRGDLEEIGRGVEALMLNGTRRLIYSLLTKRPCISMRGLARLAGVSLATTRWHLLKLENSKYVSSRPMHHDRGKKAVLYYPTNLVLDEDVYTLSLLSDGITRRIYLVVAENPGFFRAELEREVGASSGAIGRGLAELVSANLLSVVRDGKYRRYYPTGLVEKKAEAYHVRARAFVKYLEKKMRAEGLEVIIKHSSGYEVIITVRQGRNAVSMEVRTNPFISVLA
ncbi:MAG: hypothetical protein DRN20_05720 [Thermoplasmata archaeon]|nr:MAG: hypothetical protein DRN20_05720 [Thermoplasmata archaeon]